MGKNNYLLSFTYSKQKLNLFYSFNIFFIYVAVDMVHILRYIGTIDTGGEFRTRALLRYLISHRGRAYSIV